VPSSAEPALLVLIGPGGAGKGTLARRMVELDERLWLSRSWTTRARRPTEAVDAYEFVDRGRFEARIAADGFLEWAEFLDNLYGTPRPDPPPGHDVLLEIDLEGARQVLDRVPDARVILIVPPTEAHQVERLRRRGDTEAHVEARVARGREEIAAGRTVAHQVVVNEDVEASAAELLSILAGLRESRAAQGSDEAP
jgi:guanylate kinase